MASSYTDHLGFEKPGDGEQSGTWDDTLNNNFDQIEQALAGFATVTLPAVGTSGSPNEVKITNTANRSELSDGRALFIDFVDGGDLGGTAYVQFTPNTSRKIGYVRNSLSGSQSILIFQGTYDSGRDYELANGATALIRFDGGGAGAATITEISTSSGGGGGTELVDADFPSSGLMTRTASGTYTSRTLGAGNGIAITNGDGVSTAPSIALDYTLSTSDASGTPSGGAGHLWLKY